MPRSRRNEPSLFEDLFQLLREVPIWVGPLLAGVVYVAMRWVIPLVLAILLSDNEVADVSLSVFSRVSIGAAPLFAGAVLMVWIAAEVKKLVDGKWFNSQTGIDSVMQLDWRDFERLLAKAFRRQGFVVQETGGARPDGGIDLRLDKAGATTLVQCKHWKSRQVGVSVVREMLGVVASEGAQAGIVVASGRFTEAAVDFANANPIRLIDGKELAKLIREAQATPSPHGRRLEADPVLLAQKPTMPPAQTTPVPACPLCRLPMIQRTASKGPHAGRNFWGCSTYPRCRGTRQLQGSL